MLQCVRLLLPLLRLPKDDPDFWKSMEEEQTSLEKLDINVEKDQLCMVKKNDYYLKKIVPQSCSEPVKHHMIMETGVQLP